jgi:hypothetical protein
MESTSVPVYTFRFDDVSINTDSSKLINMIAFLRDKVPECRIILSVSPMVADMSACEDPLTRERVFPAIFHVHNDFKIFYQMNKIGIPTILEKLKQEKNVEIASHGMVHVDHRLLKRSAQEMSILIAASLVGSHTFIPPFHKWDKRTEAICIEHGIDLVKYAQSWNHLAYENFDRRKTYHYMHTHDCTLEQFTNKFKNM